MTWSAICILYRINPLDLLLRCCVPTCWNCAALPQVANEGGGYICVTRCGGDYYQDGKTCQACHPNCQGCVGPLDTDCKICRHHELLSTGQCVKTCPVGQHGSLGVMCAKCHPECRCVFGVCVLRCGCRSEERKARDRQQQCCGAAFCHSIQHLYWLLLAAMLLRHIYY